MQKLKQTILICLLSIIGISMNATEIPNNEIWYEASEKLTETTSTSVGASGLHINDFNVPITSHEFSNGKGVIKFNGEVTSIGYQAFSGCSSLTSIEIPTSVTSIGDYAFFDCSSLTSIEIPTSVTSIGNFAFSGCSSLTSIEIPTSVTSIGGYAFSGCSSLTSIEIPTSVTSIGGYAFYGCSSLTSIEIPTSVTSIGNGAFSGCSSLTSIEIPNSVTSIGDDAFWGCSSLTSIEIPTSVTSIVDGAFRGCSSLTSIEIPTSVTSIGDYAFSSCSSLTSIEIPTSVTSIGIDAFYGCSSLTSIEIPTSVTRIRGSAFASCSGLTSIIVESGNTKYDSRDNCNAIIETATNTLIAGCKNTIIPTSVTSIGDDAFSDCSSLTSIEIPTSVTSIGDYAFLRCKNLQELYCYAIVPPTIQSSTFEDVNSNLKIYVPASLVNTYKATSYWNNFEILPLSDTYYGTLAVSGTNGSVDVSTESGVAGSSSVNVNKTVENTQANASQTLYLHATANEDYKFLGWATSNSESAIISGSNVAEYAYNFTFDGTQSAPTSKTLYAIFKYIEPQPSGDDDAFYIKSYASGQYLNGTPSNTQNEGVLKFASTKQVWDFESLGNSLVRLTTTLNNVTGNLYQGQYDSYGDYVFKLYNKATDTSTKYNLYLYEISASDINNTSITATKVSAPTAGHYYFIASKNNSGSNSYGGDTVSTVNIMSNSVIETLGVTRFVGKANVGNESNNTITVNVANIKNYIYQFESTGVAPQPTTVTYYGTLAVSGTNGSVDVSTESGVAGSSSVNVNKTVENTQASASQTLYLHATASEDYEFLGWATSNSESTIIAGSNVAEYAYNFLFNGTQAFPTNLTLYAIFKNVTYPEPPGNGTFYLKNIGNRKYLQMIKAATDTSSDNNNDGQLGYVESKDENTTRWSFTKFNDALVKFADSENQCIVYFGNPTGNDKIWEYKLCGMDKYNKSGKYEAVAENQSTAGEGSKYNCYLYKITNYEATATSFTATLTNTAEVGAYYFIASANVKSGTGLMLMGNTTATTSRNGGITQIMIEGANISATPGASSITVDVSNIKNYIYQFESNDTSEIADYVKVDLKVDSLIDFENWNDFTKSHTISVSGSCECPKDMKFIIDYSVEDINEWHTMTDSLQSGDKFNADISVKFNASKLVHTISFWAKDMEGNTTLVYKLEFKDVNSCSLMGIIEQTYTGDSIYQTNVECNIDREYYNLTNYRNNKNAGTAYFDMEGVFPYTIGRKSYTFQINPAPLSGSLNLATDSYVYNGQQFYPEWTFTNESYSTLEEEKDYSVTYTDNRYPGTAKVTVKGKGNYTSELTKTFFIDKAPLRDELFSITLPDEDVSYDGNEHKASATTDNGVGAVSFIYTLHGESTSLEVGPMEEGQYDIYMQIADGELYYGKPTELVGSFSIYRFDEVEWQSLTLLYAELQQMGVTLPWDIAGGAKNVGKFEELIVKEGHVVGISLTNKEISGLFPSSLVAFSKLEDINLSGNNLSGNISTAIAALKMQNATAFSNLHTLNLSNNKYSGNIGILGNSIPSLSDLNVSYNKFEDLYPALPANIVNIDITHQEMDRVVDLNLSELSFADMATKVPTILLYNHDIRNYNTSINLLCTKADLATFNKYDTNEWAMQLAVSDNQISIPYVSTQNAYYGESGDVLNVLNMTGNNSTDGSTFKIALSFNPGDANFDGSINILDLQSMINYMFEEYTNKPYNFTASNLWKDEVINVQDAVSMVNILLNDNNESKQLLSKSYWVADVQQEKEPTVFVSNGNLIINAAEPVSSFDIVVATDTDCKINENIMLAGFTCAKKHVGNQVHIVGYSLSGATLPIGENILGTLNDGYVLSSMLANSEANEISTAFSSAPTGISNNVFSDESINELHRINIGAKRTIVIGSNGKKYMQIEK